MLAHSESAITSVPMPKPAPAIDDWRSLRNRLLVLSQSGTYFPECVSNLGFDGEGTRFFPTGTAKALREWLAATRRTAIAARRPEVVTELEQMLQDYARLPFRRVSQLSLAHFDWDWRDPDDFDPADANFRLGLLLQELLLSTDQWIADAEVYASRKLGDVMSLEEAAMLVRRSPDTVRNWAMSFKNQHGKYPNWVALPKGRVRGMRVRRSAFRNFLCGEREDGRRLPQAGGTASVSSRRARPPRRGSVRTTASR